MCKKCDIVLCSVPCFKVYHTQHCFVSFIFLYKYIHFYIFNKNLKNWLFNFLNYILNIKFMFGTIGCLCLHVYYYYYFLFLSILQSGYNATRFVI